MSIISFKSTPENWRKERDGIKPCTIRFTDDWGEARWEKYHEATMVEIEHTGNPKLTFRRRISDKTLWRNVVCISWRHP